MRKFAVAKGYEDKGVNLPKRATKNAAGYDFEAIEMLSSHRFGHPVPASAEK